jgi:hypothetical protein
MRRRVAALQIGLLVESITIDRMAMSTQFSLPSPVAEGPLRNTEELRRLLYPKVILKVPVHRGKHNGNKPSKTLQCRVDG